MISPSPTPLKRGDNNRLKTHCPAGHLYDQANTYLTPAGGRVCRLCKALRSATDHQARKAARDVERARLAGPVAPVVITRVQPVTQCPNGHTYPPISETRGMATSQALLRQGHPRRYCPACHERPEETSSAWLERITHR